MGQRPIWRGHLRLALVSCPIALYSAKHDRSTIRVNQINPATGNRIRMLTVDSETGQELERRDLVKGYEFKKNQYLIITDEDLDSVKVESSSTMMVEKFLDAESIDAIFYDASYYLAPDGQAGEDVYAVLREAIQKTGKLALSRVVISQRERTIALRVMDGGLVAHTLSEQRDINDAKPLFEDAEKVKTDPEMVALAVQLIERQSGRYDPSDLEDRYETRMRAIIEAKLKGEGVEAPEVDTPRDNVIDLMAALKKSLGQAPEQEASAPAKPPAAKKKTTSDEVRRQPGLKLPIKGGKAKAPEEAAKVPPSQITAKPPRRRAS